MPSSWAGFMREEAMAHTWLNIKGWHLDYSWKLDLWHILRIQPMPNTNTFIQTTQGRDSPDFLAQACFRQAWWLWKIIHRRTLAAYSPWLCRTSQLFETRDHLWEKAEKFRFTKHRQMQCESKHFKMLEESRTVESIQWISRWKPEAHFILCWGGGAFRKEKAWLAGLCGATQLSVPLGTNPGTRGNSLLDPCQVDNGRASPS